MKEALIKSKIIDALGEDAEVNLNTQDGVHYAATVKSKAFAGKTRLEQHRMVMNALQEVISSNEVHALQLKTIVGE